MEILLAIITVQLTMVIWQLRRLILNQVVWAKRQDEWLAVLVGLLRKGK